MTFTNNKAIYLQLADNIADDILAGRYPPEGRIPSVREYAATLGVNVNTAVKAYDELSDAGIIYNKRGLGYFVSPDARGHIEERRRVEFYQNILPEVFRQMKLLDIDIKEIEKRWKNL